MDVRFLNPPFAVKIKKRTEDDMSFVRMVYCEKIVYSGRDAGNGFRMRKKFCTSEARHPPANASRQPFFAAGSCSRYHLIVLRILCFGYSLHYTNERTNERTIMHRSAILSTVRAVFCAICVKNIHGLSVLPYICPSI